MRRALIAAVLLLAAGPPATAVAYDDAGYLAYADRMQERLDPLWDEGSGQYRPGPGGVDALVNSLLLLTHSVAAQEGHTGPARNDHRARLIARALVSPPVFIERPAAHPAAGSQTHVPGWTSSMGNAEAGQHLVFDAEIVDGLVHAWKARRALGLSDETAAKIADRIHRVASSRFWRWPTMRLNQVNWYALMYAADATVTGRPGLLRRDLRAQLARFVARAQLRRRDALPVPPARRGLRPLQPRFGRVREHRALAPALLQPGAARRDGPALARGPQPGPALGAPRDRRLLDPRRLPQLGHRPRVRALAPGEEARARPAGADRDRADPQPAAGERVGAVGEVRCSTAGCSSTSGCRWGRAGCPIPCCSSSSRSRRASGARGSPPRGWRRTPPARSRPGSGACARPPRRRCTRSTPTSAASR